MIKIEKELIDELPTAFVNSLTNNLVYMAKAAERERDAAALAFAMTDKKDQQNHAIYSNAKYEAIRDILLMLGKHNILSRKQS